MPQVRRANGVIGSIPEAEIAEPDRYLSAAEAKAAMITWIDQLTKQIMGEYPEAVRSLWVEEEALAREYVADPAAMPASRKAKLNRDAVAKGRTIQEQVTRILDNADRYRRIGEEIRALFLSTEAALALETTPSGWATIIDTARAQAESLAQNEGLIT